MSTVEDVTPREAIIRPPRKISGVKRTESPMLDIVQKWGRLVAERGFTQIPTYLLNINRFLSKDHQLSPVEQLVLFHLVSNWWKKEENPFPAMKTLASRCGISSRQVHRAITRLDELKIIIRSKRDRGRLAPSNQYDLSPLVELLEEIAKAYPNEYPRNISPRRRVSLKSE